MYVLRMSTVDSGSKVSAYLPLSNIYLKPLIFFGNKQPRSLVLDTCFSAYNGELNANKVLYFSVIGSTFLYLKF